jgi:glycosyltransferase involved in cell wall biosynthesis
MPDDRLRASTSQPLRRERCALIVFYGYAFNDPPTRNAAAWLARVGYRVTVLHLPPTNTFASDPPPGVEQQLCADSRLVPSLGPLVRIARWLRFQSAVRRFISQRQPTLVVTVMFHALAALPGKRSGHRLVTCIFDLPSLPDLGRLDRQLIRRAWPRLREAEVVWSSDQYKAELVRKGAGLSRMPVVCYNCPPRDYLPEVTWPRDGWLRDELRRQGATLGKTGGCIVLRSGAISEAGGIDETLQALASLPEDIVFVMMGRPDEDYAAAMAQRIAAWGLTKRAFLWKRPSDETWKRGLLGADIGHLVHGPYRDDRSKRLFALNSSLSNNRLFNYMAAGLPILSYDDPRMDTLHSEVNCFRIMRLERLTGDLRATIAELATDPEARRALGAEGRRAHLERYNWESQFKPVLALANSDSD